MGCGPNILLIVTDEERVRLPDAPGFTLPARERLASEGVTFENYGFPTQDARGIWSALRGPRLVQGYPDENILSVAHHS